MEKRDLTPRDIDDILAKLLAMARSDPRSLVYVEHAALVLDYCIRHLEPSICHSYIKLNAYPIVEALNPGSINIFNYRSLKALLRLMDVIARLEPEALAGGEEILRDSLNRRLDYYHCILGLIPEHELEDDQRRELEKFRLSHSTGGINTLFVSHCPGEGDYFNLGKLLRGELEVEITGEGSLFRTSRPFIAFGKKISELEDPFAIQLEQAVRYAERSSVGDYQRREIQRIPRVYRFAISDDGRDSDWAGVFAGGSAGLAFALLAWVALDTLRFSTSQTRISNRVVFTGSIDENGRVLPVHQGDIPLKTRAAFYSLCRYFVLPRENASTASGELSGLNRKYPHRNLELVPVKNIEQVYNDTRIVTRSRKSVVRVMAGKTRMWRKHLFSAAVVLLAVIILAILLPPRFDRKTVSYDFDGKTISFINHYGYTFNRFHVDYHILMIENDYTGFAVKSHRIYLKDFTGDNIKELLLISVESDSTLNKPTGRIHTHLFSNPGELISHVPLWDSLRIDYGGSVRIFRDFNYYHDEIADFDKDGYKEVVIATTDIEFSPSIAAVISFKENSYAYYPHDGHQKYLVVLDIDGDGYEEIILGGIRETAPGEPKLPVVSVLDPAVMRKSRRADMIEFDKVNDNNVARYYLALPSSRMCRLMTGCVNPYVKDMDIGPDNRLKVRVNEASGDTILAVIYRFNCELECDQVIFADPYDIYFSKVFGIGSDDIQQALDRERKRLMERFKYLDGEEWKNEPAVNSGYMEFKEKY